MSTTTAAPAAGAQTPPAATPPATPATPAADPKGAAGTVGTPGVSGEPKAPAATPAAPKPADPADDGSLLGKKLPSAEPAKGAAEAPKGDATKAEEYEVALPEGSLLGADHAKAMTTQFKELGLSKDQATKLAAQTEGMVKSYVDAQVKKLQETEAGWWTELQAHPKYGGANLKDSNKLATAALDRFFPGLKEVLVNSPYAAHPKLFGGLVELGKLIADGKFRMNGLPPEPVPATTPAQALYGKDGRGLNAKPTEGSAA